MFFVIHPPTRHYCEEVRGRTKKGELLDVKRGMRFQVGNLSFSAVFQRGVQICASKPGFRWRGKYRTYIADH